MFLTISLAIVDTRSSSFDATQQGEVIVGPFAVRALRDRPLHHWADSTLPVTSFGLPC